VFLQVNDRPQEGMFGTMKSLAIFTRILNYLNEKPKTEGEDMKKANKKKLTGIGGLPLAKFTEADESFIAEFINEPKPWEGKIGGGGAWDFKSIKFNPTSIPNLPASTTASCECEDNVCQKCTTSTECTVNCHEGLKHKCNEVCEFCCKPTECKLCHVLSCYHHDQRKPSKCICKDCAYHVREYITKTDIKSLIYHKNRE